MPILLRIVGAFWILMTAKPAYHLARALWFRGLQLHPGLNELFIVMMLTGGLGLLFLKEWARWLLLLGAIGILVVKTGPSILQLQFPVIILRDVVFYGIFIAILAVPHARAVTRREL